MQKKSLPILLAMLSVLLMSGCFFGESFDEVNRSESGLLLEEAFPLDTWFAIEFSTLDQEQFEHFEDFVSKFSDDPDEFRDEFLRGVDENLQSINLSYVEDIQPMLGDDGFRFIFGLSEGSDAVPVMHAGMTIENKSEAESLFSALVSDGQFLKKESGGYDVYFNTPTDDVEGSVFYFGLNEDLLLLANNESELVGMLDLLRSTDTDSLWTKESYQDVVSELPAQHVGLLYVDNGSLQRQRGEVDGLSPTALSSSSMSQYLNSQGIALVATEGGFDFRGVAKGDKDKINEADTSLDKLKAGKTYLYENMPGNDLALYMESYNLASVLEAQYGEGLVGLGFVLGLGPETNLSAVLEEGYAVALHRNSGFLPGLTMMVDVSENTTTAKTFIQAIDLQISNLLAVFQLQDTVIAEALTKENLELQGGDFHSVRLDVDSVMDIYDTGGSFELPEQVQGQEIVLVYGLTADDRFVFSSYEGWLEDPDSYLSENADYVETTDHFKKFNEGILYVSFDETLAFINDFQDFRDALSADAASIYAETPDILDGLDPTEGLETDLADLQDVLNELEGIESEVIEEEVLTEGPRVPLIQEEEIDPVDWAELLEPLKTFGFSSDASKYEVKLGGVVLLDEE